MTSILKVNQIQNTAGAVPTAGDLGLNVTGTVLQVVSTTKTDTWSGTPGAGVFLDITGLSVAITPTSTTSKILVTFSTNVSANAVSTTGVRLMRDSTAISVGDSLQLAVVATRGLIGTEMF